jgi:riboflavin synthase
MFTGLVEAVGTVVTREPLEGGLAFRVRATGFAEQLTSGDSVAVDGVCQTVTQTGDDTFNFESIRTTLSRTTFGDYEPGRPVNLERALQAGEPMGGHLVQGHVDGVGTVTSVERAGETVFTRIDMPHEVAEITVLYGSLAVDGVSMTVNALHGDVAELAIIPYTWEHTSFSRLQPGDRVNLEADLVGKYVHRLLEPYVASR